MHPQSTPPHGHRFKDMVGQRFGRLLVTEFVEVRGGHASWRCICDCGATTTVYGHHLRHRTHPTQSCGCLARETMETNHLNATTHGMTKTAEHHIWNAMKQRCANPRDTGFKYYGGRGITVCDRWLESFEAFYADMGPRPPGLTLERRDNSQGYSPENCYWATHTQQQRNRRPPREWAALPGAFKLTQEMVDAIRAEYSTGGISQREIAKRYELAQQTVSDIVTRRTWHLPAN